MNAGVGFHALLQGIILTQGLNLHLLWLVLYRWISYHWATGEVQRKTLCSNKDPTPPGKKKKIFGMFTYRHCVTDEISRYIREWIRLSFQNNIVFSSLIYWHITHLQKMMCIYIGKSSLKISDLLYKMIPYLILTGMFRNHCVLCHSVSKLLCPFQSRTVLFCWI